VGKRLGLVVLVAALSITSLGLGDKKQMGDDLVAIAGPAIAFHVGTSSMSAGLASLRSGSSS
jgi:hypothetical protein